MAAASESHPSTMPLRGRYLVSPFEDANDPRSWSGTPYYFLRACQSAGILDEALPALSSAGLRRALARIRWNLKRSITEFRVGGYWYSEESFEDVWQPIMPLLEDALIVCCACPMPLMVSMNERIRKWAFIDQTGKQYYEGSCPMGAKLQRELFDRETVAYQSCEGIIAHSQWAATSVAEDYGIPKDKIHVVIPGAHLDPVAYQTWRQNSAAAAFTRRLESSALRLVFCGNDDLSGKGLDRLIEGISVAKGRGFRGRLRIVGRFQAALMRRYPNLDGIEFAGFVNKEKEPLRFIELLADNDLGILLSRKEAASTVVREFAAVGLPTVVTEVGGMPEQTIAGASIVLRRDVTPERVSETLLQLEADRTLRERLTWAAWEARDTALWSASTSKIRAFWPYPC